MQYEEKYPFIIDKRESISLRHFNNPQAFIEYSNDRGDIYNNTDEYNPYKEHKVLIVSDDVIADMLNNKKLNLIVAQLFIRSRKLNISLVFIRQPFFAIPKGIRLHSTHYFIMKILKKQQLKQFSINHSTDIDFMNLYKKMY